MPARRHRSPRITRDDLLAFHKRWFGANNAILAIVGDVTPEEAFAGRGARVRQVGARSTRPRRQPIEPPPPTRRVVVDRSAGRGADRDPRRQHRPCRASTRTTWRSTSRSKILGGEGGNRLHRVLRSERGLTYGASADTQRAEATPATSSPTPTRGSETTGEALRLIVDEIWRLQRQRVQRARAAEMRRRT